MTKNKTLSILTMTHYTEQEYRFLFQGNSWRVRLDDSKSRGTLQVNHDVRGIGRAKVLLPYVKLRQKGDGIWVSQVLYKKGKEVIKAAEHNASEEALLDCVAATLHSIYGRS